MNKFALVEELEFHISRYDEAIKEYQELGYHDLIPGVVRLKNDTEFELKKIKKELGSL